MGLEAVVQLRRRAIRRLDRDLRLGERALRVAALVRARLRDVPLLVEAWRAIRHRLLEIRDERQDLVLDVDEPQRGGRGLLGVRRDRGHLVADEAHLLAEDRLLAAEGGPRRVEPVQHAAHSGEGERAACVDRTHARSWVRAPQHADVEHAGEVEVLGVRRPSGDASDAVHACVAPADDAELVLRRPRADVLAVDERGLFAHLALELGPRAADLHAHRFVFFAADSAAATMLDYAPQRQRLPLTARNTSSPVGEALWRSSPTHDMIWPGVQKPHWKASCSMNASCTGCSWPSLASPSPVSTV